MAVDDQLRELGESLRQERDAALDKELTFAPQLMTSEYMALPRSTSSDGCFQEMYDHRHIRHRYRQHAEQRVQKEHDQHAYFIPKICTKSRQLALTRQNARNREREGQQLNDQASGCNDFDIDSEGGEELDTANCNDGENGNDEANQHTAPPPLFPLDNDVLNLLRGTLLERDCELTKQPHEVGQSRSNAAAKVFIPLQSPGSARSSRGRSQSPSSSVGRMSYVDKESVFERLYSVCHFILDVCYFHCLNYHLRLGDG
jgi:hypothetical protein